MMLYAYWTPMSFKVTYDCGEGNTIDKEFGEALYGREYTLDVPTSADSSMVFMGWYAEENERALDTPTKRESVLRTRFGACSTTSS